MLTCSNVESKQDGKGTAPIKVTSVANLLLFNTQENPYRRFKQLDPLEGVEFAEEPQQPEKAPVSIGDQPATFVTGEYLVRTQEYVSLWLSRPA